MSGTDDFNWVDARKEGSVIVPEQAAIAVYENENGDLVMRQESSFGEDDHYIYIQHALHALLNCVVVPCAAPLPHVPIPELHHVTTMWLDVVNYLGLYRATYSTTPYAERMVSQVRLRCHVPLCGVAPLARRAPPAIRFPIALQPVLRCAYAIRSMNGWKRCHLGTITRQFRIGTQHHQTVRLHHRRALLCQPDQFTPCLDAGLAAVLRHGSWK